MQDNIIKKFEEDNYKKYIITLDYDTNNYNGIKQISAMDFLLDRVEL